MGAGYRGAGERRLAITALLCAVAGFALVDWRIFSFEVDTTPIQPAGVGVAESGETSEAQDTTTSSAALDGSRFAETLARPLFEPSRRPRSAEPAGTVVEGRAAEAEHAAPAPDGLRLVGLGTSKEHGQRALIRAAGNEQGRWIKPGEEIGGWSLKRIEGQRVVIENGGRTAELLLYPQSGEDTARQKR
jgi:hypothetical protein